MLNNSKNEMILRENIKVGDRVVAYCLNARRESRGQILILIHPLHGKIFVQEAEI